MNAHRAAALVALVLVAVPTVALAARAADPGPSCGPVPVSAATLESLVPADPVLHHCVGKIQPGSHMISPVGCTMSFIVRDETGALYISTAGHCIGATGTNGRVVGLEGIGRIGVSAFNVNAGVGNDFGLVRIDQDKYHLIDPTLCHWGGPTSLATFTPNPAPVDDPYQLLHYGFGFLIGETIATRARTHLATSVGANSLTVDGVIASGDSGSPVMLKDGGAAGVVTHARAGVPVVGLAAGPGFAMRFDRGLALAGAATGHTFTLVTSDEAVQYPLGMPWP